MRLKIFVFVLFVAVAILLLEFMQKKYPEHLPKIRISMEPEDESS